MPSKSAAQRRFMQAAAHSPKFARKAGIAQSVAKDFAAADQAKKRKTAVESIVRRRRKAGV